MNYRLRLLPLLFLIPLATQAQQQNEKLSDATLENVVKNLETEQTGLIYEHRAPTSRIEQVSRRIREALDETSKEIPAEARPRRGDMLKALTFLRETVKVHIQRAASDREASRNYLHYVSLFYPWPEETTRQLIV